MASLQIQLPLTDLCIRYSRRPVLSGSNPAPQQQQIPAPPAPRQAPAAQPPANNVRTAVTGPTTNSAPLNSASSPAEHLSVPAAGMPRTPGSASNTIRRRAGPENPLIAFQSRSASKPPTLTNSSTQANVPQTDGPSRPVETQPASTSKANGASERDQGEKTLVSPIAPQISAVTDLEAQRQQRLEAALRRRGLSVPEVRPGSARTDSRSDSTERQPTPTIKIDDASKSIPDTSESSTTPPIAEAEASRPDYSTNAPAATSFRTQHISPLISRASSPVTILDPMGAFGGRSFPQGTSSLPSYTAASASSNNLRTNSPPTGASRIQSWPPADAQSLPRLSSTDMPRLIPLFDPADPTKPSPLTRFLPSLLRSGLWSSGQQVNSERQKLDDVDMVQLPADLDDGQLASLAEVTREGLETRLRLLNSTQGTLQACINQLQQAMKVLDSSDVQGVIQVASELNQDPARQLQQSVADSSSKGKARAPEQ